MLLSQFRDKEYIRIRTSKLRDRLNIADKYKEFRKVRRCVLDVAQENLNKMFEEGESDISFTYECEFKGTPVRGQEPDYIKFHIIKRLLVSKEDYEERIRYSKTMIEKWLRQTFRLTDETLIKSYIELVTPENFLEIESKFNYMIDILNDARKSSKILDKRAYLVKALDNLFKSIADITNVD